jgi:hypothetical protein
VSIFTFLTISHIHFCLHFSTETVLYEKYFLKCHLFVCVCGRASKRDFVRKVRVQGQSWHSPTHFNHDFNFSSFPCVHFNSPQTILYKNLMIAVSFQAYDTDKSGYITKDELAQMFSQAWDAGYRALAATDYDGISVEEFAENPGELFAGG